nr:hypothetical protein [Tanacetum cinerariifolium]
YQKYHITSLQEKVLVITALKETLSKLKGKAVVNEAVTLHPIDPELLKIDVAPLAPKLRNNRTAHNDYLKHTQEETSTLREIVKNERLLNPLNAFLDYVCKYTKRIQELLIILKQTCPCINDLGTKLMVGTPTNNNKQIRFIEHIPSSGTTPVKTTSSTNVVSNTHVLSSTGVNLLSSTSGSRPQGNTNKDRIQRTQSKAKKNKLEDHPRTVRPTLNKKKSVVDTKAISAVTNSKSNVNSDLKCATCNGCLFSDNHDTCVLAYINYVNARVKSKSVKKPVNRKIWQPTGKMFTTVGHIWRPTGRTFTLVGNVCPLTRITTTAIVPLREPIPIENNTDKPVVTLVYLRKSKAAKKKVPVSNSKIHKSLVVQIVLWYLDSGCSKHMTGYRSQLINFVQKFLGTVKFENDHVAKIMGYGDYKIGNVPILRVYFVEVLGHNLFSASKTNSWLWHCRLLHLNFGAINHLARQGVVRGLPKLKFEKDHLCSVCVMGKSKKKSHKPKSEDTNQEKLYLLHMDLCGPIRVESVNGKKYILVIVDDYSQFTWVKFLRSKDEAPDFIIKFLKMIQVRLKVPLRLEPKTYKDALTQSCWIEAMQEELNEFERLEYTQLEDSNELFQKILEDLRTINKELIECNRPTFFNDNEEHYVQNKENLENSSNSNQEKEGPPKDFDIRQLIREECCIKVCEEQKQNMENTILELVKICRQKELYVMHDNVDDLIESALNFKLLSVNSQRLNKEKQEVKNVMEHPAERKTRIIESLHNFRVIYKSSISLKNTSLISPVHAVAPILSTKEPEYSPSMGYEHPNTTLETESDEIIKSGVEEIVPILSECEVTSKDKRECDMLVCKNSLVCDDHSEIFSDSKNYDDISSDDDDFKDIEYIEASLPDPEIVNIVLREKLLSINRLIANIKSLNDNPTPDCVLNSSVSIPISKESDNSLSDYFSPKFKTFCDHTEETRSCSTTTHADDSLPEYDSFCFEIEPDQERLINVVKNDISDDSSNDPILEEANLFFDSDNSIPPGIKNFTYDSEGDIRFLEELFIEDSILFPNNESFESNFDNPDEFECLDPRDEFDDDDYSSFMFVIYSKMFSFLLSAESEDTIFDP